MVHRKSETPSVLLMGPARVKRAIHRMAYQIAEDYNGQAPVLLIGLKDRGYILAQLLAACLGPLFEQRVKVHHLPWNDNGLVWKDLEKDYAYVVLVDDVIFSGRTMYSALQITLEKIAPQTIRTAVLVDRGHRSVPVEAGFTGLQLPTKLNEHVSVCIIKNHIDSVLLLHKPV